MEVRQLAFLVRRGRSSECAQASEDALPLVSCVVAERRSGWTPWDQWNCLLFPVDLERDQRWTDHLEAWVCSWLGAGKPAWACAQVPRKVTRTGWGRALGRLLRRCRESESWAAATCVVLQPVAESEGWCVQNEQIPTEHIRQLKAGKATGIFWLTKLSPADARPGTHARVPQSDSKPRGRRHHDCPTAEPPSVHSGLSHSDLLLSKANLYLRLPPTPKKGLTPGICFET